MEYQAHRVQIEAWEDFVPAIDAKNVCLARHCLVETARTRSRS